VNVWARVHSGSESVFFTFFVHISAPAVNIIRLGYETIIFAFIKIIDNVYCGKISVFLFVSLPFFCANKSN
jgi:hypothetical protein